jgi:hypothetical protein
MNAIQQNRAKTMEYRPIIGEKQALVELKPDYFNFRHYFSSKCLKTLSVHKGMKAVLKKSISFFTLRIYLFLNLPVAFNKN